MSTEATAIVVTSDTTVPRRPRRLPCPLEHLGYCSRLEKYLVLVLLGLIALFFGLYFWLDPTVAGDGEHEALEEALRVIHIWLWMLLIMAALWECSILVRVVAGIVKRTLEKRRVEGEDARARDQTSASVDHRRERDVEVAQWSGVSPLAYVGRDVSKD